jgi:hypothetical protein
LLFSQLGERPEQTSRSVSVNNADCPRSESPSARREAAPLYAHGPRNRTASRSS